VAVELPVLLVKNAAAWRSWLSDHHSDSAGVWLVLAKKGFTEPTSMNYDEALDEAICFGWIDGQIRRRDEATYDTRFTPRRAKSMWSKNNVVRVERLQGEGRMREPGLAAVEAAMADGRWEAAYAGSATIEVPDDLKAALAAHPLAAAAFAKLSSQNRYAMIFRVGNLKTEKARSRRIEQYVEMLNKGETIYPQKPG
jgi:uncharacterized protein YdeI (YjbR/CyaY-like superfamily)